MVGLVGDNIFKFILIGVFLLEVLLVVSFYPHSPYKHSFEPLSKRLDIGNNIESIVLFEPDASILKDISLGTDSLPYRWKDLFYKAGIGHMFAISGMHLFIVLGVSILLFRFFEVTDYIAVLIASVFITLYILFTGSSFSTIRAGIMSIFGLASFGSRKLKPFNVLFFAAIIILAFAPRSLFDISFQYSFVSLFFLIALSDSFFNFLKKYLSYYTAGLLSYSLSIQAGLLPLNIFYFGRISIGMSILNLLIVPFLPVFIFGSFILILVYYFSTSLALIIYYLIRPFIDFLIFTSSLFADISVNLNHLVSFNLEFVLLYYLILFSLVFHKRIKKVILKLSFYAHKSKS